jgi:hypothetical protein
MTESTTGTAAARRKAPSRSWHGLATLALMGAGIGLATPPASAHSKAHEHGVAKLDVVIEGPTLTIELDTPLDNLVGFERAPRTQAERQRVEAMSTRLKTPDTLFRTDAAAGCAAKAPTIEAPVVGLGASAGTPAASQGHADLAARFEFECRSIGELRQIDVALFTAFSGFKRIEVQLAGPRGQSKRTLTPASARLPIPR